jgi:GTP-binding protein
VLTKDASAGFFLRAVFLLRFRSHWRGSGGLPEEVTRIAVKQANAAFVRSYLSETELPRDGSPEVVLAGRSNVGKSSLVNGLVGKKGLARTGSRPGTTQAINFFRLDGRFYLVDLPGFGYHEAGKHASREWAREIRRYIQRRETIVLVLQLVDCRIDPTEQDVQLAAWLDRTGLPRAVVATKCDKLSNNEQMKRKTRLSECMNRAEIILSSAVTGQGCREIWKRMAEAIQNG